MKVVNTCDDLFISKQAKVINHFNAFVIKFDLISSFHVEMSKAKTLKNGKHLSRPDQ